MSEALHSSLGFRLEEEPILWGALQVVCPNPVLRFADAGLETGDSGEHLVVSLVPRAGHPITDLEVTVWEERAGHYRLLAKFRPSTSNTRLQLPGIRQATALAVDSDTFGRVVYERPSSFIARVGIEMTSQETKRDVTLTRGGRPDSNYRTTSRRRLSEMLIGEPKVSGTVDVLQSRLDAAKQNRRVSAHEEVWFGAGNRHRAQELLRRLVHRASRRVWVTDYFFSAPDIGVLVPAVASLDAEIRVLTSREGLGFGPRGAVHAAGLLSRMAERVRRTFRMQEISIKFMPGKRAQVHDRFLVVDDRVYLMGSSLNNYGGRGTILVKLSNPAPVLDALEEAWEQGHPIEELAVDSRTAAPLPMIWRCIWTRLTRFRKRRRRGSD